MVNPPPGPLIEQYLGIVRQEFAKLGYVDGKSIAFDIRFARGDLAKHPEFAADLVKDNVDAILTFGGPASAAAKNATSTIPIVFSVVTDPVALKLAASMQKPGGNVTGFTNLDPGQAASQIELLKEAIPSVTRIAILSEEGLPGADSNGLVPIERDNSGAAQARGLHAQVIRIKGPMPDYDGAFATMLKDNLQALIVLEVPQQIGNRKRIADLATKQKLPTVFPGGLSDAGGLLTYGTTVGDTYAGMPAVVDKILKGTPPGEIPVGVISRRELIVNATTAAEIGVAIPQPILSRADKVIR
ncbi:ABC transporter substrate-binding protein [Variovorax sp. J22R24]|uniref:ABC transporter substrate-binding protein n=1 Tax=Variovorax gracilis TaxID=3053502 RepID=UPI0025751CD8|nr:ABC transporter substrate-binding protein [Variovorax sp. J22R24]MDM0106574.1 ABC transporter substrate-binding protein [Variovorax sp. J22R24]